MSVPWVETAGDVRAVDVFSISSMIRPEILDADLLTASMCLKEEL